MEITSPLDVTEKQIFELEMHSFVNIITIVNSLLQMIAEETKAETFFRPSINYSFHLGEIIHENGPKKFTLESLMALKLMVIKAISEFARSKYAKDNHPDIREYIEIIREVFKVLDIRVNEWSHRLANPDQWQVFTIEEFKNDFKQLFYAMEKNSKGRYRIIYNIADQEEKDYLVHFEATSDIPNAVLMPYLLKDVMRDIISNARKYTHPGGKIEIGISISDFELKFVVKDNGCGIPVKEIPEVVKFGYRADNVKNKVRTMGGGFGLTKAWFIVHKLGGRMWIESEPDIGTKISLIIPIPKAMTHPEFMSN